MTHETGFPGESATARAARHRRQHADDLAALRRGGETGWWDECGAPAPWPEDFFDHDSPWADRTSTAGPDLGY